MTLTGQNAGDERGTPSMTDCARVLTDAGAAAEYALMRNGSTKGTVLA